MERRTKTAHRRSQRDYSLAFKLQVVQQVEKGELSYINGSKTLRHLGELNWNFRNQYCKDVSQEPKLITKNLDVIEQKLNKAIYQITHSIDA